MMQLRYDAGVSAYCILRRRRGTMLFYLPPHLQMLAKKVDTLTKAMEVEAKKMRREVAAMEKEVSAMRLEKEQENKAKRLGSLRGPGTVSQALPGRYAKNALHFENLIS